MDRAVLVHGTGSIGTRHLRVLGSGLGVRALARPVRPGVRIEGSLGEGVEIVDSYEAAAALGASAAIIATSTGRHLADAHDAIGAGFHLLVEKPLASSAEGIAALERAATAARRQVFVGCCLRFDSALRLFRDWLPRIGRAHDVRVECQSFLPDWRPGTDFHSSYAARADEGGVLRDLVHEIDYAAWLFGWPTAVAATLTNTGRLGIDSDEAADLFWRASGGAHVSVRLDYLTRPARRRMRASGELGSLEVDLARHRVVLEVAGAPVVEEAVLHERDDMMKDQARAFLAAVDGAEAGDLATLEDGARALAICDAARRSSTSGRTEPVRDWRSS